MQGRLMVKSEAVDTARQKGLGAGRSFNLNV